MMPVVENTQIQTLPPLTRPPHDSLSVFLDGRTGWQDADLFLVEKQPGSADLALQPIAGEGPAIAEPSGSLGGAVAPAAVAIGPRGTIYLLDTERGELLVFDPCCCRFDKVPCLGGLGKGARQLNNPQAIAICNGNLFITDFGNQRVSVFSLEGFLLRDHWMPPKKEPFAPYGIAIDGKGRVFVTDPMNLRIHRFAPTGQWEKSMPAPGVPRHLAIDCQDLLYVVRDAESSVAVLNGEGEIVKTESRTDAIECGFPPLPFRVLPGGSLDLSEYCAPDPRPRVFDLSGKKLTPPPAPAALAYPAPVPPETFSGRYWSQPIDSEFFNCQWHRIVACACVPVGTSLRFATHTASALLTQADVEALPDYTWQTNQVVRATDPGLWDCLILSSEGRYLWLRIDFISNGKATPAIRFLRVEFPRITLRRFLPAVFGETSTTADFTDRFLAIFDTTIRSIETLIDRQAGFYDPISSPANDDRSRIDFLSYIASWIGIALDRNWPEESRREFVAAAARLFPIRGTPEALRQLLLAFFGIPLECCPNGHVRYTCGCRELNCRVPEMCCPWEPPRLLLEHFELRRWMFLDSGRLGDQAVLWGSSIVNRSQLNANARADISQLIMTQDPYRDPFHVFAHKFSVFVPARAAKTATQRRSLNRLLNEEKPVHTQFQLEFVEPRFRVGIQSVIGLNSVVGRYPEGVSLDESKLGDGTVLTEPPHRRGGPSFAVGRNARIGSTSTLE